MRIQTLEEALRQIEGLQIVRASGSLYEGTSIVVSLGKPVPLLDTLRQLPHVEQVVRDKDRIHIRLRAE